jgi:putative ABC transport system substrate-binding protein
VVIGVLSGGGPNFITASTPEHEGRAWRAFHEGLTDVGYVDGRNVSFEYSWANNQYDQLPALAAELVRRRVAVIVAMGAPPAHAARAVTSTIPIVFQLGIDPVATGLVASVNRPGGNVTGATNITVTLVTKRLQLVRQLLPTVADIGVLVNPANRFATEDQSKQESSFTITAARRVRSP